MRVKILPDRASLLFKNTNGAKSSYKTNPLNSFVSNLRFVLLSTTPFSTTNIPDSSVLLINRFKASDHLGMLLAQWPDNLNNEFISLTAVSIGILLLYY